MFRRACLYFGGNLLCSSEIKPRIIQPVFQSPQSFPYSVRFVSVNPFFLCYVLTLHFPSKLSSKLFPLLSFFNKNVCAHYFFTRPYTVAHLIFLGFIATKILITKFSSCSYFLFIRLCFIHKHPQEHALSSSACGMEVTVPICTEVTSGTHRIIFAEGQKNNSEKAALQDVARRSTNGNLRSVKSSLKSENDEVC